MLLVKHQFCQQRYKNRSIPPKLFQSIFIFNTYRRFLWDITPISVKNQPFIFSSSPPQIAQCNKKILYSKCKGGYQLMLTYQVLGKSPLFAPSFSGVCKMFLFWHFWGIFLCSLEVFSYLCPCRRTRHPKRTSLTLLVT